MATLTIRPDSAPLLRGHTPQSGRRYDDYLAGLPARPIARRAAVARQAGDTQTGLLIAESLTAPGLQADDREELAEKLTRTVLEPWQTGPFAARADLFGALAGLDPDLPDWLKAAGMTSSATGRKQRRRSRTAPWNASTGHSRRP